MTRTLRTTSIAILALCCSASVVAQAELRLPNKNGSTKFLVLGDTGTGGSEQYQVGKMIASYRERFKFDFAIMVGDNLYGSERPQDYAKKFERPYQALIDGGVKFYAALGNHDDPNQRFYKFFNMGGERYYKFNKGPIDFFVLDSNYMEPKQLAWLESQMQQSGARWKMAYFHHPVYSSGGRHGSEVDLRQLVEPLFIKYGLDVVFAGHEHFYERVKPQKGIYYFTCGGSAKLRQGNIVKTELTEKGFDADNSFMLVEVNDDTLSFQTISRLGRTVDAGTLPKVKHATITTAGK